MFFFRWCPTGFRDPICSQNDTWLCTANDWLQCDKYTSANVKLATDALNRNLEDCENAEKELKRIQELNNTSNPMNDVFRNFRIESKEELTNLAYDVIRSSGNAITSSGIVDDYIVQVLTYAHQYRNSMAIKHGNSWIMGQDESDLFVEHVFEALEAINDRNEMLPEHLHRATERMNLFRNKTKYLRRNRFLIGWHSHKRGTVTGWLNHGKHVSVYPFYEWIKYNLYDCCSFPLRLLYGFAIDNWDVQIDTFIAKITPFDTIPDMRIFVDKCTTCALTLKGSIIPGELMCLGELIELSDIFNEETTINYGIQPGTYSFKGLDVFLHEKVDATKIISYLHKSLSLVKTLGTNSVFAARFTFIVATLYVIALFAERETKLII